MYSIYCGLTPRTTPVLFSNMYLPKMNSLCKFYGSCECVSPPLVFLILCNQPLQHVRIYTCMCMCIFLIIDSIRSSLKLSKCNEWFSGFVNDWVNTACTIFQTEVAKSSGEIRKVRHVYLILKFLCCLVGFHCCWRGSDFSFSN